MKKRGFKFFVLTSILALGVSSCGTIAPSGEGGQSQETLEEKQKEIYQLAVNSGYSGTYEEWIASIRGENGSSILFGEGAPSSNLGKAGDGYLDTSTWDVYFRTNSEWKKAGNIMGKDGQNGQPGKDGVSIVSIVKTGEDGNVDTYTITYSDGHTSTFTVTNGQDGESIQGEPGIDGHTPVIEIKDGYWVVDNVSTGILAQGPQGPIGPQGEPGKDGVSIVSIELISSVGLVDTYQINYSDKTHSTFTVTNGAEGAQGIQGIQGIQGEPGKDGHTPVIEIKDGYWVVDNVSTGILAQGPQGPIGPQGEPGKTAWSNTILPSEHGYVTVSCGSALVGERTTFYAYPDAGYKLTALYMNNINVIDDVIEIGNHYMYDTAMVEHGYVVRAIFSEIVYTATFLDYQGEVIGSIDVGYGESFSDTDVVDYDDPRLQKPSDDNYTYRLVGWLINGERKSGIYFIKNLEMDEVYEPVYETIEKDVKARYGVQHEGTYDDPFTNEDAIIVAKAIYEEGATAIDGNTTFYIKGILDRYYNAPENMSNGYVSFYLEPAVSGGEQFEIYGARSRSGEVYTFENLYPGVEVLASGRLTVYNKTQPETASGSAYIEEIHYISDAPEMKTVSVSVSEAIAVVKDLEDGNVTYDKYQVTGYVVKISEKRGFYISDSLEDTTNVLLVEPYFSISGEMIDRYFQYGTKISITDHLRNYHNVPTFNRYELLESMIEGIEEGTQWPGMPTGIIFYDEDGNQIENILVEQNQTLSLTYELLGDNPSEEYLNIICRGYGIQMKRSDGRIELRIYGSTTTDCYATIDATNIFGKSIGFLDVYRPGEYIAPESIYCEFETKTVNPGDKFYAESGYIHALPEGATVEGYRLVSSDETIATTEHFGDGVLEFIAEGEVDVTIIETSTGLSTVVHFVVEGLNNYVVAVLDSLARKFDFELTKEYSTNSYAIHFTSEDANLAYNAYEMILNEYDHSEECAIYNTIIGQVLMVYHSSLIRLGGYNFAVVYAEQEYTKDGEQTSLYGFAITLLPSGEEGHLMPLQQQDKYEIGDVIEFMPIIDFETVGYGCLYFESLTSSNPDVAVVDNERSNRVTIVGNGTTTISCFLQDGTILEYNLVVGAVEPIEPEVDLTDAILLDYSNCGYWRASMSMQTGNTNLYLLPTMQIYVPLYKELVDIVLVGEETYFENMGNESYMGVYFKIDENGVMSDIEFTPLENKIIGNVSHASGVDFSIELGEDGIAKAVFGEPISADVYVGYKQTDENRYVVATPMGIYTLLVTEAGVEVYQAGGSDSGGGSGGGEVIPVDPDDPKSFVEELANRIANVALKAGLEFNGVDNYGEGDYLECFFEGSYPIEEKDRLFALLPEIVSNAINGLDFVAVSEWEVDESGLFGSNCTESYIYTYQYSEDYYIDLYIYAIDDGSGSITLNYLVVACYWHQ